MVWKSCAPATANYCESDQRKQIERKVNETDGGYNFLCSRCDNSHKCNDKFPSKEGFGEKFELNNQLNCHKSLIIIISGYFKT